MGKLVHGHSVTFRCQMGTMSNGSIKFGSIDMAPQNIKHLNDCQLLIANMSGLIGKNRLFSCLFFVFLYKYKMNTDILWRVSISKLKL